MEGPKGIDMALCVLLCHGVGMPVPYPHLVLVLDTLLFINTHWDVEPNPLDQRIMISLLPFCRYSIRRIVGLSSSAFLADHRAVIVG